MKIRNITTLLLTALFISACGMSLEQNANQMISKYTGQIKSVNESILGARTVEEAKQSIEKYSTVMLAWINDFKLLQVKQAALEMAGGEQPDLQRMMEPLLAQFTAMTANAQKLAGKFASNPEFKTAIESLPDLSQFTGE